VLRNWRRWGGIQGLPWALAAVSIVSPALLTQSLYRYAIVAIPLACLAAGLNFARLPGRPWRPGMAGGPEAGSEAGSGASAAGSGASAAGAAASVESASAADAGADAGHTSMLDLPAEPADPAESADAAGGATGSEP
jgi:hypothetical protein